MTRKSQARLGRRPVKMPRPSNIASATIDHEKKSIVFTTNDMLIRQLHRDGPRIAKSFDRLTKNDIAECSAVFAQVQGLLLQHLPRLDAIDFKATASRLLFSASNSYVASIEVARHGYPRQYGVLARVFIETLATVIVLAIRSDALEEFHAEKLSSTKCVSWAKAALPEIGQFWGMLSNHFVHIGKGHDNFEAPSIYKEGADSLIFIVNSIRSNVWMLQVVADLIFSDETVVVRYWRRSGQEVWFEPTPQTRDWMASFLSKSFENSSPPRG